jgi:two-component system sensor histidine kinase DctS
MQIKTHTDFLLLRNTAEEKSAKNDRVLFLLFGLFLLLITFATALVVYLKTFENSEEIRTQSADALWVEENLRFHLRRLEDDLRRSAQWALTQTQGAEGKPPQALGGSLRSHQGGLIAYGWQPVGNSLPSSLRELWHNARRESLDKQALDSMHDVAKGLKRPAYAGPLSGGSYPGDEIWLSVPLFEKNEFVGSFVAVFSLRKALELIIPAWFRKTHRVEVLALGADLEPDAIDPERTKKEQRFLASVDMPGSDTYLQIYAIDVQYATVPRALLGTALLFLVGMVASLVFLRRDIEKRQSVENSLAAEIALRRSMENSIGVGILASNLNGCILYVNRAVCEMVGSNEKDLLGNSEFISSWFLAGNVQEETELNFSHPDKRSLILLIHRVPLCQADNQQIGWMLSLLDITERRRSEKAALVQQQRLESAGRLVAIGEVASTLAHELNQPLGAMSSFTSGLLNRLKKGDIDPPQIELIVERISALAIKTGGIIRRVNAFARRREMNNVELDLTAFLQERYALNMVDNSVRIILLLPSMPVLVKADTVLMEQALRNVVQNAVEAASTASKIPIVRIELSVSSLQMRAYISVFDNGTGIEADVRARIFDAFYSSKEDGMGMGLAICRSILEAHHGGIELLETANGNGSCFKLWIPMHV